MPRTLTDEQKKNMELIINTIQTLKDTFKGGAVMPDELAKVVKLLLDSFKEIKIQLEQKISSTDMKLRLDLTSALDEIKKLETRLQNSLGEVTNKSQQFSLAEVSKIARKLEKDIATLKGEIPKMPDLSDIKNRVADIEAEVKGIEIPKIEDIEKDLPKLSFPVRDSLELIVEESEKLKIEAIGYLRKELDEIKKKIDTMPRGSYGGGFNYGALNIHLIDDETPVGTIDGSNKDFTVTNIPSPTTSLKVFVNGQRMKLTEDYTFSGNTISFVTAPPATSILTVDYRT